MRIIVAKSVFLAGALMAMWAVTRSNLDRYLVRIDDDTYTYEDLQQFARGQTEGRQSGAAADLDMELVQQVFVEQELLIRHAQDLRLDEADPVIRARLVQLALEDASLTVGVPSDENLSEFFAQHVSQYAVPAMVKITHVAPARYKVDETLPANTTAEQAFAQAEREYGLWSSSQRWQSFDDLARNWNQGFASRIMDQAAELQTVPFYLEPFVESDMYHFVRIDEYRSERVPPLDQVRAVVERDWKRRQKSQAVRLLVDKLYTKYDVVENPR